MPERLARNAAEDSAYAWLVVAALSVSVTVSYGVLTYAFGVVLVPMQNELGWSRIELTGAFSVALAVWAAAGVGIGAALDRFSHRIVLAGGSALAAGLVVAWSQVRTPGQLYVVFAGLGLAMAALLYNSVFAVVTRWFGMRRRQALTAITLVGAFSSFIFAPLTGAFTAQFGWRQALIVLAAILAAVGIPIHALALRRAPEQARDRTAAGASDSAREVLASRRFWYLTIALALGSFTWLVVVVQLVPYLVDAGYGIRFGALAAGLVGLGQLPGRLVFVFLGPALHGVRLPVTTFGLAVLALGVLTLIRSEAGVIGFAVAFGMSSGMLTLMSASLPADLFGRRLYGTVSGVIYGCSNGARAVGPFASAAIGLLPGGFRTLFGVLIACCLAAAALGWLALRDREPTASVH